MCFFSGKLLCCLKTLDLSCLKTLDLSCFGGELRFFSFQQMGKPLNDMYTLLNDEAEVYSMIFIQELLKYLSPCMFFREKGPHVT